MAVNNAPAIPNAYALGSIPVEVSGEYFTEYTRGSNLGKFMGSSASSGIQVSSVPRGHGETKTFNLTREMNPRVVNPNYTSLYGSEQKPITYVDQVQVFDKIRTAVVEGFPTVRQVTPIDMVKLAQEQIMEAHKEDLTLDLFDALTVKSYATTDIINDARVIYGGLADTDNTTTIATQVAKLTNGATPDKDGLSVDKIYRLASMARMGGTTYKSETRVHPLVVKTVEGFPSSEYALLIDPRSADSLRQDAKWNAQYARGVIESSMQPTLIDPGQFIGMIANVKIYVCPELSEHSLAGNRVAWNVLLGGRALALVWGEHPVLVADNYNYMRTRGLSVQEIRGQKSLKYPSDRAGGLQTDWGMLHLFTQIA